MILKLSISSPKTRLLAYAAATLGFVLIEALSFAYADQPIAAYMRGLGSPEGAPGLIAFFRRITDLGLGCWYLWPCGIATIFCAFLSRGSDVPARYRHLFGYIGIRALFLFATIGISGIAANIVKPLVGRARPTLWLHDGIYGFDPFTFADAAWKSFPSGHATTVFAFAFALAFLYPRGRFLWFAYALLLSLSRIFVNAHFLSDVLAGGVLGWLSVCFFKNHGMTPVGEIIFPIDKRKKIH